MSFFEFICQVATVLFLLSLIWDYEEWRERQITRL